MGVNLFDEWYVSQEFWKDDLDEWLDIWERIPMSDGDKANLLNDIIALMRNEYGE